MLSELGGSVAVLSAVALAWVDAIVASLPALPQRRAKADASVRLSLGSSPGNFGRYVS
jgi:hypothetical protein